MKNQVKLASVLGPLFIVLSDDHIYGIHWRPQVIESSALTENQKVTISNLSFQLSQYFKGELKEFDLPIKLVGSDFQLNVWTELLKIPFGKTISYKELAIKVNNPKASRAVGGANSKNPISILVPCHRVIQSSGGYGGYAGGGTVKKKLLDLELGLS